MKKVREREERREAGGRGARCVHTQPPVAPTWRKCSSSTAVAHSSATAVSRHGFDRSAACSRMAHSRSPAPASPPAPSPASPAPHAAGSRPSRSTNPLSSCSVWKWPCPHPRPASGSRRPAECRSPCWPSREATTGSDAGRLGCSPTTQASRRRRQGIGRPRRPRRAERHRTAIGVRWRGGEGGRRRGGGGLLDSDLHVGGEDHEDHEAPDLAGVLPRQRCEDVDPATP